MLRTFRDEYERLLPLVEKPGRYLGNERGAVQKDPARVRLRFALAFPDVYEIAQSHPGLQILYDLLNRRADVFAERVYAPWFDMEAELRRAHLPLASLETCTALGEFDMKTWIGNIANAIRAAKADQVGPRLQKEFFEGSRQPSTVKR